MITTGAGALRSIGAAFAPKDDFHDHLAGRDRLDHLDADRPLLDLIGKAARDVERHIGLEQRASDLAERGLDIGF